MFSVLSETGRLVTLLISLKDNGIGQSKVPPGLLDTHLPTGRMGERSVLVLTGRVSTGRWITRLHFWTRPRFLLQRSLRLSLLTAISMKSPWDSVSHLTQITQSSPCFCTLPWPLPGLPVPRQWTGAPLPRLLSRQPDPFRIVPPVMKASLLKVTNGPNVAGSWHFF